MDAHHFLLAAGHEAERVGFAEVVLLREGEAEEVLGGIEVGDAGLPEAAAVEVVGGEETTDLAVDKVKLSLFLARRPGCQAVFIEQRP